MGTATEAPERSTRPSADPTRERILEAAIQVFAEASFDGASTRRIATLAGVAQPLLNYHFVNKEVLWRAAVDSLVAERDAAVGERVVELEGIGEPEFTREVTRELIRFSARRPELRRITTTESKVDGPRLEWLVETHLRRSYDATAAMIERLVGAGHMPGIDPTHVYYILSAAGSSLFDSAPAARRLSGIDPMSPEAVEAHADAVLRMLFGD